MNNDHGHWAKFSDAVRDVEKSSRVAMPHLRKRYALAAELLTVAQRFYLPDAINVLEGRMYDDDVKTLVRLPHDVTALLSECSVKNGPIEDTWKITLAFDPHGAANARLRAIDPRLFPAGSIPIISLVRFGAWVMFPAWAFLLSRAGPGYDVCIDIEAVDVKREFERHANTPIELEFTDDVTAITNLCMLLNLHNVTRERVGVPAPLEKKRRLLRRKPLYDYHVLSVDGERWDSAEVAAAGDGEGVRSHLRRGHIRRLSPGRHTWVRATYVHGSVDGFVDKDYSVRKA